MILVDERTRERVEEVVAELLRTGDYDKVFRCFASQMMMNSTRDGRRQTLYEPDGHGLRLLAASRIALDSFQSNIRQFNSFCLFSLRSMSTG